MGEVAVEQSNGDAKSNTEKDVTNDDILYERIIAQLEYYFSDVNLSRDRFMQQQIREDDGWLPLDLLLKFKRLASILGDRDKSVIVQAVRTASNMLEVNSDEDKVRRSAEHPLPDGYDELRKTLMTRTVYVKGFPLENITFDQILEFFKSFGKIESVIMRHYTDRVTKKRGFKGSAFVTFPTVEDAEAFLKRDDIKYNDAEMIKKWQSTYIEDKRKERLEYKLTHQQRRRDNKKSSKGDQNSEEKEEGNEQEEEKSGFPLDAVIHFSGLSESSTIHRDQIREAIESLGLSVAFIDFSQGDKSGFVRLDQANSATQLLEKLGENGKLKVDEEELEVRKLEGEEESNYLDRARKEMNKRRQNNKSKKRRGGRGGHFNDRGRKRRGGPAEGAPPAKAAATE